MSFETGLKSGIAAWLTSETRLNLARAGEEVSRRVGRRGRELLYFHRTDDPYCQLMVQALPDLASRFDVKIKPLVIERLPANMYPDPQRFEAYSILDATRLARLYGLGFPSNAMVPDRLNVGMANRYLVSLQDDPSFFTAAEEVGEALWRNDHKLVRSQCVAADIDEHALDKNEKLLKELGHYASATVYYGGEFYLGLDRLDHLEHRLNRAGVGDGEVHFELTRLWRYGLQNMEKSVSGRSVKVYFSVRSPYSYLGLHLAAELAEKSGVRLKLKPVLPMMMRGMKVPKAKGRYILMDTAREARAENIPFGRIVDPLGLATKRAMGLGFALAESDQDLAFFKAFTKGVWAEGIDGTTDAGLRKILDRAGIGGAKLSSALPEDVWGPIAERNRQALLMAGAWGVPTFRVGNETLWGQDRLWAVVDALKQQ
ncbi:DsbA family protein [Kordiimonas lacus]|uniref:2-hydroxychromene-2-carboxylate isomerase n=1 Tax=Kordiimonas lacus TaxID=637679 RepID=A0A1G7B4F3_9PROT|nr:DsbA family protein [Kordiimonas lacus]SDE21770.1 2-hydroxychromene-2-carboxylate isomerase [Kordiimonas lacus]